MSNEDRSEQSLCVVMSGLHFCRQSTKDECRQNGHSRGLAVSKLLFVRMIYHVDITFKALLMILMIM